MSLHPASISAKSKFILTTNDGHDKLQLADKSSENILASYDRTSIARRIQRSMSEEMWEERKELPMGSST